MAVLGGGRFRMGEVPLYGIAYRRVCELSTFGSFQKSLRMKGSSMRPPRMEAATSVKPLSQPYRVTSLIRNNPFLGPNSRTMSGATWWS